MIDYSLFDMDELLALVRFDFGEGNLDGALHKIKMIYARSAFPIETFALSGKIYARLGLLPKAKAALSKFVDEVNGAYLELFQLALIELDLGDKDASKKYLEDVLKIKADYPPALYHMALHDRDDNDLQAARQKIEKLLELGAEAGEFRSLAEKMKNELQFQ